MKNKIFDKARVLIALMVLLGMMSAYAPVSAQDPLQASTSDQDVEAIYRAQMEAFNNGDLEGAMAYYAEDAISVALPPPPDVDPVTVGKEAVRAANATMIANKPRIVFTDFHVTGNTATLRTITTDDFLKSIGVNFLEFSGTIIVRDGLIVTETFLMDKDSQERLEAALTLLANKELVGRVYDEVFNQGDMAVVDEIFAPEVTVSFTGHTGSEAVKEDVTGFRTLFPDLKIEYRDMVAEGDLVVVNIAGSGTYAGGLEDAGIPASAIGKKITWHGSDYNRIVNGKIVEVWGTHDDAPWFEQFGMKLVPAEE
jgi:predicted ester cyclase